MTARQGRTKGGGAGPVLRRQGDLKRALCPEQDCSERAAAARGGESFVGKKRLTDRFDVPGAFVVCRRRTKLGFWKQIGTPSPVCDMGVGGLSFLMPDERVKPGAKVRLTLHLPGRLPIKVKGEVHRVEHASGEGRRVCGVGFTDYGTHAWAILCGLHAEYGSSVGALPCRSGSGIKEPQIPSLDRVLNGAVAARRAAGV